MIPSLSSQPVAGVPWSPVSKRGTPLVAQARGGATVGSPGAFDHLWTCRSVGNTVYLSRDGGVEVPQFSAPDITFVSLAFNQSMDTLISYVSAGVTYLWWRDSITNTYVHKMLGNNLVSPRILLDDSRIEASATSDVLVTYIRGSNLYLRAQRDRFDTEYLIKANAGSYINSFVMLNGMRLRWSLAAPAGGVAGESLAAHLPLSENLQDTSGAIWTPTGDVAIVPDAPKWGPGSARFNGGYIDGTSEALRGRPFTIELWVSVDPSCPPGAVIADAFVEGAWGWRLLMGEGGTIGRAVWQMDGAVTKNGRLYVREAPLGTDTWRHIIVQGTGPTDRGGVGAYMHVDGSRGYSAMVMSLNTVDMPGTAVRLGAAFDGSNPFIGKMQDFRIVVGTQLYGSAREVVIPTGPLPH